MLVYFDTIHIITTKRIIMALIGGGGWEKSGQQRRGQ